MPLGERALNPETPYLVYEFLRDSKVFYVGVAHGEIRHAKRWGHVMNLMRHEDAGTLTAGKAADLNRRSNRVIAAMARAGLPEHEVRVAWRGPGKASAEAEEGRLIRQRASEGCLLANVAGNPRLSSVEEILAWLGVPRP